VAELNASAGAALESGHADEALRYCEEAIALEPHNEATASLRREAERVIASEHQRIAVLVEQLVERAAASIASASFEAAERTLDEAEALRPGLAAVIAVREQLTTARAAAAAAERLARISADEIRLARSAFRRGREEEAVRRLESLVDAEPGASDAARELAHLKGLRERMQRARADVERVVMSKIDSATAARDAGAYDEARGVLRSAIQLDPTNPAIVDLLADIAARQLDARIAQERRRMQEQCAADAEPLVTAARTALERGYIGIALKSALAAHQLAPDAEAIAEVAEALRAQLNTEDQETFSLLSLPLDPAAAPIRPATGSLSRSQPNEASDHSVLDWAVDIFRTSLRRLKA
jgi:tetratricopeptide (TPR) repeat protein